MNFVHHWFFLELFESMKELFSDSVERQQPVEFDLYLIESASETNDVLESMVNCDCDYPKSVVLTSIEMHVEIDDVVSQ